MTAARRLTVLLLLITITSKLIGFIREITLLEAVGISADLDAFVILYAISGLIISVVGVSIMTNLTPIAHASSSPNETLEILVEGVKVGGFLTFVSWVLSVLFVICFAPKLGHSTVTFTLASIIPLVVLFAIIAEYQVAIFLSRNNQLAVVCGNIIISAPLILLMLLSNMGIASYSIGLVACFGIRAAIFTALIYKPQTADFSWWAAFMKPTIMRRNFGEIVAGGSAMTAVNLVFLGCLLAAQYMGPGMASFFGYGLKVPMLVLTSIWFVFGAQFFSRIVAEKGANAQRQILKLTGLNILITICMATGVGITILFEAAINRVLIFSESVFIDIIQNSLPFLPLIIFVPIIEMMQRTLVTIKRPKEVLKISAAVCVVAIVGLATSLYWSRVEILALAMLAAIATGAVVAAAQFRSLRTK